MAVVLCRALWKPCELMADACDSCCQGLAQFCSEMCGCMAQCCDAVCDCLNEFFYRPFSGCVFFMFLMNLAPLIAGAVLLGMNWNEDCVKPLNTWLLVAIIIFVINLFFAIYVFSVLSSYDPESDPDPKMRSMSTFQRAMHMLMYDPIVALYIVFGIFMIVWAFIGVSWVGDESDKDGCTDSDLYKMSKWATIILQVFIWGGLGVTLISLCSNMKCAESCFGTDEGRARRRAKAQQMRADRARERAEEAAANRPRPVARMANSPPAYNAAPVAPVVVPIRNPYGNATGPYAGSPSYQQEGGTYEGTYAQPPPPAYYQPSPSAPAAEDDGAVAAQPTLKDHAANAVAATKDMAAKGMNKLKDFMNKNKNNNNDGSNQQ